MDKQKYEYVNKKFVEIVSRIEKKPAAFAGECSLSSVAKEIRNIINVIKHTFGVEIDFEIEFKKYVLEYYGNHYSIGEKEWSNKSWDEIIVFFHIIKENAVLQFFSLFHDFSESMIITNEKTLKNIKLFEKSGSEIIKEYIESVEKEPLKYMNDISLKKFYSSLSALEYVVYFFSGMECFDILDGFLPYVCLFYSEKYRIKDKTFFGSRSVEGIISFFSKDHKEAFYTFFKLYKKFNSEKAENDYKKIWEEEYISDLTTFFEREFLSEICSSGEIEKPKQKT